MQRLAESDSFKQLVGKLADQIRAAVDISRPWAIVGIRSRGDILAKRLADLLQPTHLGTLDITLYRDDLSEAASQPVVRTTEIDFDVTGLDVVLIDDVLMTGRSIRAALQVVMDFGRPRRVWLGVLVDRGGRELPICPDFVARTIEPDELTTDQRIEVRITPTDSEDALLLCDPSEDNR
jgi:pyrimidine operon attenuation protein/uracil phosphoribosyltransferase